MSLLALLIAADNTSVTPNLEFILHKRRKWQLDKGHKFRPSWIKLNAQSLINVITLNFFIKLQVGASISDPVCPSVLS